MKEAPDSNIELIAYFVFSPEWGPGHRVYADEDIKRRAGSMPSNGCWRPKATGLFV
jgi:hypothetical protein